MASSCSDTAPAYCTLSFRAILSPHIPESICQEARSDPLDFNFQEPALLTDSQLQPESQQQFVFQ